MVSALWKAAADGNLSHLNELLKDASHVDIEVKDHTGVTPLIQAVRNGHAEVVKELLARGADPNNASSQGKPETYTQDPVILELLKAGGSQPTVNGQVYSPHTGTPGAPEAHSPDGLHHYDQNGAPQAPYPQPMSGYWYMPHGGAYPPHPYMPPPPAESMPPQQHPMQGYYPVPPPHHPQGPPPQPSQDGGSPQEPGHQQQNGSPTMHIPPDVARTIPCRYFPMCKYGASCMFLHPAAPYYNVPAPPVPYAGYEAMNHPPAYAPHGYYGVPPPPPPQSFAPPPPPAAHATGGPQSPVQHTGGAPPQHHGVPFPADGSVPPPPPPGAYPYPPPQIATSQSMPPQVTISPTAPYHPAPVVIPVQPPVPTYTSPVSPTLHRKESGSAINYPQQPPTAPAAVPPTPQANGFVESPVNGKPAANFGAGEAEGRPHFQSNNGYRRGGFRKTSFNGPPRPPCLFFPAGKCKNGTECRFPHVRPEDDPAAFGPEGYPPQSFPQRNTRPPNHMRGGHGPRSFVPREDAQNGDANGQPRPHMTNGFRKQYPGSDFTPRGGFHNGSFRGGKFGGGGPGHHVAPVVPKEKVLSPADFPSLNGSSTPLATNGHVNGNGLTAAQVLKRNAPQTPAIKELAHEEALADAMAKVTINGHAKENGIKAPSRPESPDLPTPVFPSINDTVTSAAKLVAAA